MRPVLYEALARKAFGLGNLVFVMGKNEVPAAAVNVYLVAERSAVHCRALYVPAGSALAPGRRPADFALLCRLPQREVGRVALFLGVLYPYAVEHVLHRPVRKATVSLIAGHVEVYVSARRGIRVTLLYEPGDEVLNVAYVFGGLEPYRRVVYVHLAHDGVNLFYGHCGILVRRYARLLRARDYLVVDVGIVARIGYRIPLLFEVFPYNVVYERLKAVTYVRLARDGYAAGIHLYFALFEGHEFFLSPCQSVVNSHLRSPFPVR